MPADESVVVGGGRADGALCGTDIGHGAGMVDQLEHLQHALGQVGDRRGDDHQFGGGDRLGQRLRSEIDGAALTRDAKRAGVRVESGYVRGAGLLCRKPDRGPDQACADDRQARVPRAGMICFCWLNTHFQQV
jgi:hypothetical protein